MAFSVVVGGGEQRGRPSLTFGRWSGIKLLREEKTAAGCLSD